MKPVGGYFELELSMGEQRYHQTPHTLKSGRSALHYILSICKPSLVYVPYYTCKALLQSFEAAQLAFEFYTINDGLEPASLPELKAGEYFLYINYFDLKGAAVNSLSDKYNDQLIVDCTQAFFAKGNGRSWFFNSCRKFFGVPDGAYVYAPNERVLPVIDSKNEHYTLEHLVKRFNGHAREGYSAFQQNEQYCDAEITGMSTITQRLLSHINYKEVIAKRRTHFNYLHQAFKDSNQLQIVPDGDSVPMVYPLLPTATINRQDLYNNDFFIPTFWPEVINGEANGYDIEKRLAKKLLPLPIDHRYSVQDMEQLVTVIQRLI